MEGRVTEKSGKTRDGGSWRTKNVLRYSYSMHAKKMVVGGMGLALFLVVLMYGGLWGFERYMEASILLEQLDAKVNGPSHEVTSTIEGSLLKGQQGLDQRVSDLEHFVLLPRDAMGRPMVKKTDLEYLVSHGGWTWNDVWHDESLRSYGTSTMWWGSHYALSVPHSQGWGNATFGVSPYEEEGPDGLAFGPLSVSEMTGVYRGARFSIVAKETLEHVLQDPVNQNEPCVGSNTSPTKARIGKYTVVKVVKDNCEMGGVSYILPGKFANYLFSSYGDEEILRWTIEHFKEEK